MERKMVEERYIIRLVIYMMGNGTMGRYLDLVGILKRRMIRYIKGSGRKDSIAGRSIRISYLLWNFECFIILFINQYILKIKIIKNKKWDNSQ